MSRRLIPLALLASLALAPPAFADASPEDRAAADALYTEAGKLAKENRWAEACAKLEASIKLDPGIGAMLHLADCYEKTGRPASAWTTLHDAHDLATKAGDKRAKEAEDRARLIEPTLSKLAIAVAPESGAAAVEVRRDGSVIEAGAWGTPVPVDPGGSRGPGDGGREAGVEEDNHQSRRSPGDDGGGARAGGRDERGAGARGGATLLGSAAHCGGDGGGRGRGGGGGGCRGWGAGVRGEERLAGDCHGSAPLQCNAAGVDRYGQAVTLANVANVGFALGAAALATGAAVSHGAGRGRRRARGVEVRVGEGVWVTGRW